MLDIFLKVFGFSRMEMVVGCEMVAGSGVPARSALLGTSVICAGTSGRAKLGSCPGSVDTQLGGRRESRLRVGSREA